MPACASQGSLLTHFMQRKTPQKLTLFSNSQSFLPSEVVRTTDGTKVAKAPSPQSNAVLCHEEIRS